MCSPPVLPSRSPRGGAWAPGVAPPRPVSRRSPPIATSRTLGVVPTSCETISTFNLLPGPIAIPLFALKQAHRLFRCDPAAGQLVQNPVPLLIAHSRGLGPDGETHRPDHVQEPRAEGRVGEAELSLHPVELPLAADERLDELELLRREGRQAARPKGPPPRRVAAAAMQSRHLKGITADRA